MRLHTVLGTLLFLGIAPLTGCGGDDKGSTESTTPADAGTTQADGTSVQTDGATGGSDTGAQDTGADDAGTSDTGIGDVTTTKDSGSVADAEIADSGADTSGTPDTGTPDTGTPDTGTSPDTTSTPDTTTPPDACAPKTCAVLKAVCGQVADGCGGTLKCGTCKADQVCNGANQCEAKPCVPKTCKEQSLVCGSATDGCGKQLACGTCKSSEACEKGACICQPKTCNELGKTCGKHSNGCGKSIDCGVCPTCDPTCPTGWTCGGNGLCENGKTTGLVLDYKVFKVSGTIKLNGKSPKITAGCKNSDGIAKVTFKEIDLGYTLTDYLYCKDGSFDWKLSLYPGTYEIWVGGFNPSSSSYYNKSDLGTLPQRVFKDLKLSKDTVGLVLDYKRFKASGSITLNGKAPKITAGCKNSDGIAKVTFKEKELGYTLTDYLYCKDGKFDWSVSLYPGTYEVWVGGFDPSSSYYYNMSDMGTLQQRVFKDLKLSKDTVGLVLDYKRFKASGSITHNGQSPKITAGCKNSDGIAKVTFKETTLGYTLTDYLYCKDGSFDWSLSLYPGTYEVWVGGFDPSSSYYYNKSDMGTLPQRVLKDLKLSKDTVGLVLGYKRFKASGSITLNGKAPKITAGCKNSDGIAKVTFKEKELGYVLTDYLYCKDGKFDWSLSLYPGTYEVWVGGFDPSSSYYYNKSDMGTLRQRVFKDLKLNKDTVGLVLDYKRFTVSGSITRNGKAPKITAGCKSSDGIAKVTFKEKELGYVL
ncbi:MAG: hypothetical protein KC502_05520, partial [Myxococcales bacterium]|nr:hypothetical protein [Myxococcales bacterium]